MEVYAECDYCRLIVNPIEDLEGHYHCPVCNSILDDDDIVMFV